jgi:arsenite methyltransferase
MEDVKACCATLYESDFARMLLGDSFHPGGLRLTQRLGDLLGIKAGTRALDVASGKGESAIFLAKRFGCNVVGIDFSAANVAESRVRADSAGVGHLATFLQGDAERIDAPDASFDAVICECAFCTFPSKQTAAAEFARVLRGGGTVGLSDLTRSAVLSPELNGLLAWIACIADARPVEEYSSYLRDAGFADVRVEPRDNALSELVREIQGRLLGVELMSKVKKLDLDGIDFEQAKQLARAAAEAVRAGQLGYALVYGQRC